MNLGFIDRAHGGWTPEAIGVAPLSANTETFGGLALGLATSRRPTAVTTVTVFHRTDQPASTGRLTTVRSIGLPASALRGLDALIAVGAWPAEAIAGWKRATSATVVLWAPDGDPAIADIDAAGWAFPSEWALQQALRRRDLPPERTFLWRPIVLPGFEPRLGDATVRDRIGGGPWLSRLWPELQAALPGVRGVTFGGEPAARLDAIPAPPPDVRREQLQQVAIWVEAPDQAPASSRGALEALASGCEVVATQVGGIWEQCGGFGRFVGAPLDDVDARLVRRVARAWADPRRHARMHASAGWAAHTQTRDARATEVERDLQWLLRLR
jgi:hypothetical protein